LKLNQFINKYNINIIDICHFIFIIIIYNFNIYFFRSSKEELILRLYNKLIKNKKHNELENINKNYKLISHIKLKIFFKYIYFMLIYNRN